MNSETLSKNNVTNIRSNEDNNDAISSGFNMENKNREPKRQRS